MRSASERTRGFGLLEIMVVMLIAGVILVATLNLLRAGLGTSTRSATQGMAQEEARRTVDMIARELKDSSETSTGWEVGVNPNPYTQFYDNDVSRIRFSRCVGYFTAGEIKLWGPVVTYDFEPPAGAEPGKVTRAEGGVVTRVCDGVSAFTVRFKPDERLILISVTVEHADPESPGHVIRSICSERVRLRN